MCEVYDVCPQCGNELIFEEGCKHCVVCGWEACGY